MSKKFVSYSFVSVISFNYAAQNKILIFYCCNYKIYNQTWFLTMLKEFRSILEQLVKIVIEFIQNCFIRRENVHVY